MSPPDTNLEKQAKRHKGPLGGMALVAVFVVIITIAFAIWLMMGSDGPEGADAQVDGRTGEITETDEQPLADPEGSVVAD